MKIHPKRSCDSKICHGSGVLNGFFSPAGKAPHAIVCFANRNTLSNKPHAYNDCNGITLALAARAVGKMHFASFAAMGKGGRGALPGQRTHISIYNPNS